MADRPQSTDGIEFLSESFWDADGKPVDDPKKAAGGEVTVRYPDGRVATHLLTNDRNQPRAKDAGEDTAPRRLIRRPSQT